MSAKAMRASLLASATATSLKGLICISLQAQACAPTTSSAVLRGHIQPHFGIFQRELGNQLSHGDLRKEQWCADAQPAARFVAARRDRGSGLIQSQTVAV
jgi:hypothetical protein